MTTGVKSFRDLPRLFAFDNEEPDMGFIHKKTPEKLDKMIQFIHHFQQQHNGDTPQQTAIANEVGIAPGGISWFMNMLINDNRLEKISSRPFRVRILEHPKNRAALKRLEKALRAADAIASGHPELSAEGVAVPPSAPMTPVTEVTDAEPLPATAEPLPEVAMPTAEVRLATAHRAFADTIDPRPTTGMSFAQASAIIAAHGHDLETIARLYIMATAKPGDLLEQLLDRGYTVAKTNPRWRD